MSTRKRHIWEFIETLIGPAVFAAYFGLTYAAVGLIQAERSTLLDVGGLRLALAALTFAALAALVLISVGAVRRRSGQADKEDDFLANLTLWLALLSILAVLWTALSAAMLT
jgi:hypothetical protein